MKTNDSNINFQINFQSEFHTGSLEYNREQTRFFLSIENDEFIVERPFDLINTFSFPIIIHNFVLNDFARNYFTLISSNKNIVLKEIQTNHSTKIDDEIPSIAKSIFKLSFNKRKFLNDLSANRTDPNYNYAIDDLTHKSTLSKVTLQTSMNNFDIPLFIYDGKMKFVSFLSSFQFLIELANGPTHPTRSKLTAAYFPKMILLKSLGALLKSVKNPDNFQERSDEIIRPDRADYSARIGPFANSVWKGKFFLLSYFDT